LRPFGAAFQTLPNVEKRRVRAGGFRRLGVQAVGVFPAIGRDIALTIQVTKRLGVKRTLCAISQFITPGTYTRWPRSMA